MIGKTKKSGLQVGVRKTLNVPSKKLWRFIVSERGMSIIAGDPIKAETALAQKRESREKIEYMITTLNKLSHLRMQWKFPDWEGNSILQIRVIDSGDNKSVLAFHQEKLADEPTRAKMQEYWEEKIEQISKMMGS